MPRPGRQRLPRTVPIGWAWGWVDGDGDGDVQMHGGGVGWWGVGRECVGRWELGSG